MSDIVIERDEKYSSLFGFYDGIFTQRTISQPFSSFGCLKWIYHVKIHNPKKLRIRKIFMNTKSQPHKIRATQRCKTAANRPCRDGVTTTTIPPSQKSKTTNYNIITMVKVWYQPPPYGPRTALNRPGYGNGGDLGPRWVVQLSKMPPGRVICGFIAAASAIAYIPLSEYRIYDSVIYA